MIDWIRKNKEFLSIRAINDHLGMPPSTLQKAVDGSQKLGRHWEKPLSKFIKALQKP